jgi:hypothetical protein
MTEQERAARTAELWDLRHSDPTAVLTLYRRAVGVGVPGDVPPGLAFSDLIDEIVGKEAEQGAILVRKSASRTVTLECPNCEHKGEKQVIMRRSGPLAGPPQPELAYFVCPKCDAEYPVPTTSEPGPPGK